MRSPETQKPYGLVGWYKTPAELFHACEALRDEGYRRFDAHTPFPVHGLERAMGMGPSRLPWLVLLMGLTGCASGLLLQWWTGAVDYPLVIGGKPFFAVQYSVPVTFELTVLLSAFGCFFGLWAFNRLPTFFHPVMQHPSFERATDDRFFLAVESRDPRFDLPRTKELLEKSGIQELTEVSP